MINRLLSLNQRVSAFAGLGRVLAVVTGQDDSVVDQRHCAIIREAIEQSALHNGWFTMQMVSRALSALVPMLDASLLLAWASGYLQEDQVIQERVLVVSAGNIPAVGFHDWLCVLMSGHSYLGKVSSDDRFLIPAMARVVEELEPGFIGSSVFTDQIVSDFDKVIATGSGNTSRYFEYYFSRWPHLIRSNRTGIAVLRGGEDEPELNALADDITLYYGLGCRNVSACFIPENYDPSVLCEGLARRSAELIQCNKWVNNYDYQKALMLINNQPFYDTGALLLRYHTEWVTPVAVINLIRYSTPDSLRQEFISKASAIQCVVSAGGWYEKSIPFGTSQQPGLDDYADGVDTMLFLLAKK
ncbi:MAG: hypothetical protein A2X11_10920 [Bacteroidetes bacterium GWE2_42_24]|nr:MAG: hypothetical protein A2X11_10920 [Bacteroidetes bacterium GWE2_42_24]OFY32070.1 MAG: hypothetical protein A2X09_10485 [Bacteroidetes bacterium GWF2_43_11]